MKVKLVNTANAAGLIDPHTKRSPFIDPETKAVRTEADVGETNFWLRRVQAGEVERVDERTAPTGLEPLTPLTTRGKE